MAVIRSSVMRVLSGIIFVGAILTASAVDIPPPPLRAYRDHAMSREGAVRRGKEWFFSEQCACARCHTVDGSAAKAGPDLFAAGDELPRQELVRAILEPSQAIAVGYATTIVETKSGEEYLGIIRQATDQWTELMLADGKTVRINASDIAEQRGSNISLMPEGLQVATSLQE